MTRYIVVIQHDGKIRVVSLRNNWDSPYSNPLFLSEKCIYTYGVEYIAVATAIDQDEARSIGLATIQEHFPEAPITEET